MVELKNKLTVTKDFIDDLCNKSWQEIEHLQTQLANIADSEEGKKVSQLIKNLVTSYYVFIGSLENLNDINYTTQDVVQVKEPEAIEIEPQVEPDTMFEPEDEYAQAKTIDLDISEPFEYFVDFDEPTGEPLTDEDLYN